jgi:membrane-associated progesterone receptor component
MLTQTSYSGSFFTPLNIILISAILYTAYSFFRAPTRHEIPKPPPPVVFKTYTPRTLLPLNGENNTPVYLAVRGKVYDVSMGRNFYGPGGPYANFAGRDASRGLACGSFDEDMLTEDLDGPLDTLADLTADQVEALQGWEERFNEKYDIIGRLVSTDEYNASEKK